MPFFSVHVAVSSYAPIEIQPEGKWSKSKWCTEEGDSRGHANILIFINASAPSTQEYLSTKIGVSEHAHKKKHPKRSQNFDILLGYVTFKIFVILKGGLASS